MTDVVLPWPKAHEMDAVAKVRKIPTSRKLRFWRRSARKLVAELSEGCHGREEKAPRTCGSCPRKSRIEWRKQCAFFCGSVVRRDCRLAKVLRNV